MRRVGEILDELDLKGKNDELVKELVALATEHGILTPYTSFLADETSDVRDVAENRVRALDESEALGESSGKYGFDQRGGKAGASDRHRRSPAPSPAAAPMPAAQGGGRWRGRRRTSSAATSATTTPKRTNKRSPHNCRQIGRKTFFQRGDRLVDSTVTDERGKAAKKIERYSREYFDLIERYGKHVAQYLALDEPVVINLGGETYEW